MAAALPHFDGAAGARARGEGGERGLLEDRGPDGGAHDEVEGALWLRREAWQAGSRRVGVVQQTGCGREEKAGGAHQFWR